MSELSNRYSRYSLKRRISRLFNKSMGLYVKNIDPENKTGYARRFRMSKIGRIALNRIKFNGMEYTH